MATMHQFRPLIYISKALRRYNDDSLLAAATCIMMMILSSGTPPRLRIWYACLGSAGNPASGSQSPVPIRLHAWQSLGPL